MGYPAYPAHRKLKHHWLDQIPASWDSVHIKLIAKRYSGGTPDKSNSLYWTEGTIPWLNSGEVNQGVITKPTTYITEDALSQSSAKWVPENALIIALAGQGKTKGTASITTLQTTCNQSMAAVIFESDQPKFMYWWLVSQYRNIRGMASDDARDGLNLEMIGSIFCPRPSPTEQQKIADFLDWKTGQIDGLIAKKQQLIEKLKEKHIALITQAVTKGLNTNAPMRDSGIPWLGEVPEHWEVRRLKFILKSRKGTVKTGPFGSQLHSSEMIYNDVKVYNQKTVITRDINGGDNYISKEKFKELKSFEVFEKDLLITTRGTIGRCMVVPAGAQQGILHPCLMRIQVDEPLGFNRFVEILIQNSGLVLNQLLLMSNSTTIEVIYSDSLKEVLIPTPPEDEQRSIAVFLDSEINKIDGLITKNNQLIEKLTEYRTALITAATTGKIDIRNVKIGGAT
ncbi:MAG: restriction endonuclease subunit S [Proteobacteria bacterium]|nr:restriction endonuclease subunit S [Pseudomonadota bacterium]